MKAIVLAGGKSTRLHDKENPIPKVIREAGGKPLVKHVLDSISYIDINDIMIVVGFMYEMVMNKLPEYNFVRQGDDGYGTGYAMMCGYNALDLSGYNGDIFVLQGDTPCVKAETLAKMAEEHHKNGSSCTLLTHYTERKLPFGRISRNTDGSVAQIVEEKNCTPEQKLIKELNVGMYVFNAADLGEAVGKLKVNPVSNEYYLTDIIEIMCGNNKRVDSHITYDETELWGVNTPEDLAIVGEILSGRNKL